MPKLAGRGVLFAALAVPIAMAAAPLTASADAPDVASNEATAKGDQPSFPGLSWFFFSSELNQTQVAGGNINGIYIGSPNTTVQDQTAAVASGNEFNSDSWNESWNADDLLKDVLDKTKQAPAEEQAPPAPAEVKPETKPAAPEQDQADADAVKPAQAEPIESAPAADKPAQAGPAESEPAQVKPAESEPAQIEPAESEPAQVKPAEAESAESEPAEVKPAEAEPAEANVELNGGGNGGLTAAGYHEETAGASPWGSFAHEIDSGSVTGGGYGGGSGGWTDAWYHQEYASAGPGGANAGQTTSGSGTGPGGTGAFYNAQDAYAGWDGSYASNVSSGSGTV